MKPVLYLLSTLFALAACTNKETNNTLTVTVSIPPLRYFTEKIAGEKYQVGTMLTPGGTPESYEPTARQMIILSQSSLYIEVGDLGFERTWGQRLRENAPDTKFINASAGIKPALTTNGIADPHTWMSAQNALKIAQNIYKALVQTFPKDSLIFKKNAATLNQEIRQIDAHIRQTLKKKSSKAFLIYHPTLTYFARDYGLKQLPVEEEGREPSAEQLRNVIQEAIKQDVKTLFVQLETANKNAEIVARETDTKIVKTNPLGYDWPQEIVRTAEQLQ